MAKTLPKLLPIRAQAELELRRRLPEVAPENRTFGKFMRYQANPVEYARENLGVEWWGAQREIAESVRDARRTVVYAGHAVGKTHLLGGLVQWHFDCFSPGITLTTAPNWNSIHDLLWGEVKAQRLNLPRAAGRLLDMRLEGGPMHYAKGHNAESGAGFQGRHEGRMLIVLDEAMGIPPFIWEATNAMMSSPHCRTLAVGNPTETSGEYYELRENPDWRVIRISCLEHPNIAAELAGLPAPYPKAVGLVWVREMLRDHAMHTTMPTADAFEFPKGSGEWYEPDDVFRARVLGLFPRQAANSVFGEAWIERARIPLRLPPNAAGIQGESGPNPHPTSPAPNAGEEKTTPQAARRPFIGVDVARFGNDWTVLYARVGPAIVERRAYLKQDTMETVGRVLTLATEMAAQCGCELKQVGLVVDDTGLGGGVTDRLRELGHRVQAENFGGKARAAEDYYNRGSEMWFGAAQLAKDGKLDLSRLPQEVYQRLSAELRGRRYKMQSDKTLRVESKDDLKRRIGRSPDDADALVLCLAGRELTSGEGLGKVAEGAPSRFGTSPTGGRWGKGERRGWRGR